MCQLRNFQTRNGASVVLRTFRSNCEQRGLWNEHPVVDVRARPALLRTLTLWGTWRINPRHTASPDRSHESSEYLKQITRYDFLWPPCVADADIVFSSCGFFYLSSFLFPRLLSAVGDWMSTIYHVWKHMVSPLVPI